MGREGVIPLCPRGRAATITRLTGQGPVAAPQAPAAWSTLSLTAHHCPRPGRGAWRTLRRTHGTSSSHTMPVMSHGSLVSAGARRAPIRTPDRSATHGSPHRLLLSLLTSRDPRHDRSPSHLAAPRSPLTYFSHVPSFSQVRAHAGGHSALCCRSSTRPGVAYHMSLVSDWCHQLDRERMDHPVNDHGSIPRMSENGRLGQPKRPVWLRHRIGFTCLMGMTGSPASWAGVP